MEMDWVMDMGKGKVDMDMGKGKVDTDMDMAVDTDSEDQCMGRLQGTDLCMNMVVVIMGTLMMVVAVVMGFDMAHLVVIVVAVVADSGPLPFHFHYP